MAKLETYPGYPDQWVDENDLEDLEMDICEICDYVVSNDEHFECQTCNTRMCLYCWQNSTCPEHGQNPANNPNQHELKSIVQLKLLEVVADKKNKQNDVATQYRKAFWTIPDIDWREVNSAIIKRWSKSGLIRIKKIAWRIAV